MLLGASGTGKTSFCMRAQHGFVPREIDASVGCDFFSIPLDTEKGETKLLVWDTAGQEVYKSFVPNFARNAVAALIFYDLSAPSSAEELETWTELIPETTTVILVPSKYDLVQGTNPDPIMINTGGRRLAHAKPISSKENINVQALLAQLADIVNQHRPEGFRPPALRVTNAEKKDTCCRT